MGTDTFAASETFIPRGLPLPDFDDSGVTITHLFSGKGYSKVFELPAGKAIVQHKHKTNHQGVLLLGRANLTFQGRTIELIAPTTVNLIAHHMHGIIAITDCVWCCVWTDVGGLTDPEKIDNRVIER